jgi:hypothetical protein
VQDDCFFARQNVTAADRNEVCMEGERNRSALPLTLKCTIYYIDILLADLSGLFGKTDLQNRRCWFLTDICIFEARMPSPCLFFCEFSVAGLEDDEGIFCAGILDRLKICG